MTTEEKFRAAVNVIKNLPKNGSYQPSHDLMLRFYAYFKQATEGPCRAPRPAFWEVVKKMKWDAWSRLGDMPREEAMDSYVEELKKIVETMSYTDNVASFLGSLGSFYEHVPAEDLELLVGPVIQRLRSQPGSPLGGSPFGSREPSPTRGGAGAPAATVRMLSSLETSPASSYSASPLPPDADDDDDDDDFKDSVEAAPERFAALSAAASIPAAIPAPVPAPATKKANGVANGHAPPFNGFGSGGGGGGGGGRRSSTTDAELAAAVAAAAERAWERDSARKLRASATDAYGASRDAAEPAADAVADAVAEAVARMQRDLQQLAARVASLERAVLARDARPAQQKAIARRSPGWWPLRDLEPRTMLLVLLWPVLLHGMLIWMDRRRQRH